MALTLFSVIGVVFAFLGLGVFLLSMVCLLPVNMYNAILSCIKIKHAIPLMDTTMIPTLFFIGNILLALISFGLFYKITRTEQKRKNEENGKMDGRGTTSNNSISHHSVFSHHKHSLMNGYTYTYVLIDLFWACAGSFFLYKLVPTDIDQVVLVAMSSQLSLLWFMIYVMTISASMMGISSIFFAIGKKNTSESKPLFSPV